MIWHFVCFAVTKVIALAKIQLWRTPRRVTEGYERLRHDIYGYLWFRRVFLLPDRCFKLHSGFTRFIIFIFNRLYIAQVNIALVDNGDDVQNCAAYLPLMR